MLSYEYHYVIINKRTSPKITLKFKFDKSQFSHLCGLHKLNDIEYVRSMKRDKIFDKILSDPDFVRKLENSSEYSSILDRIECLEKLEYIIDNSPLIFKFNPVKSDHSLIKFDYLIKLTDGLKNHYYLTISDINNQEAYGGCSCFTRTLPKEQDYAQGHIRYYVLQKTKVNLKTNDRIDLYINPEYKKQLKEETITKTLEADLSSISTLREDIHQNKEDSLDTYFDLRDTFSKSLDTKFKRKTAIKLLKEEYKKADNDEVKSLIQEEIDAIDKFDDSGSPTTMDFRQLPKSPQITVNPNGTIALSPSFHFQPPDFSQLGKKIKKAIKSILPKSKPKKQVHKKAASTAQKTAQKTSSATKSTTQKKVQDKPTEQKKEPVAVAASAPATKKEARMTMSAVKTVSKNIKKREASSKSVDDRQRSKNDIGIE